MSGIQNYSTVPSENNKPVPNGWPEGQPPSSVNDCARQNMADTRTWYEDAQWVNYGYLPTFVSGTSFNLPVGPNYTALFQTGRRIKMSGFLTGTIYGTIKSSSFSIATTVVVIWDSGTLVNEVLTASLAAITSTNNSIPYIYRLSADIASADSINLNEIGGDIFNITGTTAIEELVLAPGQERTVKFTGVLTLTNGANLVLPTSADIVTEAGDTAIFRAFASGVVVCIAYLRASGKALVETFPVFPMPVGGVIPFTGNVLPAGYIPGVGTDLSRTAYAALFDLYVTSNGFTPQVFTVSIGSPGIFNKTAHGFTGGERIRLFTTGALPTNLDTVLDYFVNVVDINTFTVSATFGAAPINTAGSQSGTQTYLQSFYGLGDGSTTFGTPNFADYGLRGDLGRTVGSYQLDAFQSHFHFQNQANNGAASNAVGSPGGPSISGFYSGSGNIGALGPAMTTREPYTDGVSGIPRTSAETRMKNIAMTFLIKY